MIDARNTDYIDPDVKELLRAFKDETAPARGVQVSWVGFRDKYNLEDNTQFIDYSTRELQSAVTPEQVLQILKDGHERFRSGRRLSRNFGRQVSGSAAGQHPLAVVLSCIDSRAPAELVFDCGLGDHLQRPRGREHHQPEDARERGVRVRGGRGEADPGDGAHAVRGGDGGGEPVRGGGRRGDNDRLPAHRPTYSGTSRRRWTRRGRRPPAR